MAWSRLLTFRCRLGGKVKTRLGDHDATARVREGSGVAVLSRPALLPPGSSLPSTSAVRHRGRLQHSGAGRAFSGPACRRAAGSAFPTDISLTAGEVGSLGLATMTRPGLAELERRRDDPPTRRRSFPAPWRRVAGP